MVRRDRLFEPEQIVGLELPGKARRARDVVAGVDIDAEVDVRPDRLTHSRHPLDHGLDLPAAEGVIEHVVLRWMLQVVDVELERPWPFGISQMYLERP